MISQFVSRVASRSPYICPSCSRRLISRGSAGQRRTITQGHVRKTVEAEMQWGKQAREIKAGERQSMLAFLENRGYVNQIVGDRDDLDRLLTEKRAGLYVGVDPTAPSMHVGHLLPLMVLYWAYIKGYHACSLLGGATAQIGDPIGRMASRDVQRSSERTINMTKIHLQLKSLWLHVEKQTRHYGYNKQWAWRRELINNNLWFNQLTLLQLLKVLGRGVRLGTMLGRDTVKNRMKEGAGMSFAEFTYPLLQSWDWWHMYSTKDIQIQVGGSDQFGNILAGIDAINHIRYSHHDPDVRHDETTMDATKSFLKKPMGFTVPLLTTASGEKFGKSAGNAIWLDQELTSPFYLYQFFLRMADADVHRYLKLFTFEPLETLEKLMDEHSKEPSRRVAQHTLARQVLELVHGKGTAEEAEAKHRSLFRRPRSAAEPEKADSDGSAKGAPFHSVTLPKSLVYNQAVSKMLYHAGMVSSRSEGHRLVVKGGVYIGSRPDSTGTMDDQVDFAPAENWTGNELQKYIIGGDTLIIRAGKWKVQIIKIIDDGDFDAQGLTANGWEEWKKSKEQVVEN